MNSIAWILILLITGNVSVIAQKRTVNTEKSVIAWTGKKIGTTHHGEVKLQRAFLEFSEGKITGGEVVMDMTTITNHDLKDDGANGRLIGHLKSDDFFGVEKYPTASFVVTEATDFTSGKATVTGQISIKGNTETISFDVLKKGEIYTAQVPIDRSKFDVRYGSGSFFDNLGDKAIDDIFILDVELTM